jgi:hypothetical protein
MPGSAALWTALELVAMGLVQGRFNAHLPLMDLPNRWGGTGLHRLPYQPGPSPHLSLAPTGPVLATPCPSSITQGSRRAALKVGIVWQGRPTHADDRLRSLAPAAFQPLFDLPGLAWVSLQKDAREHPGWLP